MKFWKNISFGQIWWFFHPPKSIEIKNSPFSSLPSSPSLSLLLSTVSPLPPSHTHPSLFLQNVLALLWDSAKPLIFSVQLSLKQFFWQMLFQPNSHFTSTATYRQQKCNFFIGFNFLWLSGFLSNRIGSDFFGASVSVELSAASKSFGLMRTIRDEMRWDAFSRFPFSH